MLLFSSKNEYNKKKQMFSEYSKFEQTFFTINWYDYKINIIKLQKYTLEK
ncbi:hypothetical protein bsdtb5_12040 [Anaeromicropila herbilytica]|uniref:Uncharacterized protein n=1 Tax=Anaeromicropila herbilytica TaxID=2785025 RepID=A0A7R7EJK7_9FIRM|nr:hypothetical protein bsdtb5_12040 [Anaeromicropila herbilytica]